MGGYGTYKLGLQWPDLFGAAFTTVGPPVAPGYLNTSQLIENARWVPYLNWAGRTDALVPIALVRAQQQRFDELGPAQPACGPTRAATTTSPPATCGRARARSSPRSVVQRDPTRVDYAFVPAADRRRLGLVHDHAYWVSHLRAPATAGAAQISARSLAFGRGFDPVTKRVTAGDDDLPKPESVTGTEWERIPARRKRNALWTCGSRTSAAPTSTAPRAPDRPPLLAVIGRATGPRW